MHGINASTRAEMLPQRELRKLRPQHADPRIVGEADRRGPELFHQLELPHRVGDLEQEQNIIKGFDPDNPPRPTSLDRVTLTPTQEEAALPETTRRREYFGSL